MVLFGATGYTGRLTAAALVQRGARPVLAGRDARRLAALAADLGGGLELAVTDVSRPQTVRAVVAAGDVLVTTVGPFARWGDAAADAAVEAGAHYIDSAGEPAFVRQVFERHGPRAARAGVGMLTAFGYDWVPGNLAGALALREAGAAAVRVDVGYFVWGGGISGGTRASVAGALGAPSFAWRGGALQTERGGARRRAFRVRGKDREALSVGSSEHFALPRLHPGLREVNVYLGWSGALSRPLQAASLVGSAALRLPGARALFGAAAERLVKGSSGGPDAAERSRGRSHVVAAAYDGTGEQLAEEVHLAGGDAYGLTARLLAWAAERVAAGDLRGTGALGPVEAFGLDLLEAGCAEAGARTG